MRRPIFVVEDDGAVRDSLKTLLGTIGEEVQDFASCEDFLATYDGSGFGCLILDVHMAGMTGLELLSALRAKGDPLPVILMTGRMTPEIQADAASANVLDLLRKPVDFGRLAQTIRALI